MEGLRAVLGIIGIALAVALVIAGIAIVAYVVLFAIAVANLGSNK
jgi:hypothetical protein